MYMHMHYFQHNLAVVCLKRLEAPSSFLLAKDMFVSQAEFLQDVGGLAKGGGE